MNEFRVSERGGRDLLDIYLFGIEAFGAHQALRYQEDLDHCFQLLADHPGIGRYARNTRKGVRRHEHASHVIFYEEIDGGILILAVAHAHQLRDLSF